VRRFVPAVVVILAPLLLFWRVIVAGEVLYWGVPLTQFYPWHTLINQALAAGQLPLWTDLLGNGAPLLANHQTALFYPPNLLFRLLPVEHALGYSVVLHVIGAGLSALYWGRTLGLGWTGRMVLALSYALGGYVMGRTQFITMVAAYAWLPLLLALTERLAQQRRGLDAVWLGSALALQFLAGHAQTWFYSLLLVLAYGLYRAVFGTGRGPVPASVPDEMPVLDSRGAPRRIIRTVGLLALAIAIAMSLSAVQLLPTVELVIHSQRNDGAEWDFAMTYSYWPWRLLTLLAPDLFGNPALDNYAGYANYWEDHAYVGVLPLLFVLSTLLGALRTFRRPGVCLKTGVCARAVPFFGWLLPVAAILAMGNNTPAFPLLFQHVPGFGFFQAPARLMLWFAIAAGTLAGIGADRFRLTYRKQYVLRLTVAGAAAMLIVTLAIDGSGLDLGRVHAPALVRLAILAGAAGILLLLFGRSPDDPDRRVKASRLPRPAWSALVVVLVGADLALAALPLTPTLAPQLYHASDKDKAILPAVSAQTRLHVDLDYQYAVFFKRYFRFDTFGPRDVGHWSELRTSLLPNINAVDGVASTGNNDPLVIGRWRPLLELTRYGDGATTARLLQLMNAGFTMTDRPGDSLQLAGDRPDLYRLPESLPRAWLVYHAEMISDPAQLLKRLADPGFDPRTTALFEAPVVLNDNLPESVASQAGSIVSLHEDWNRRTIRFASAQPGYLMLAYTYYPGWQASLDGQSVAILRANYAFSAVPVPGGEHEVILEYRPVSLAAGAAITSLALLATLVIVVWGSRSACGGEPRPIAADTVKE
jgi:hypothetical protein